LGNKEVMFYTVNVVENGIAEYRRINYNNHMRQAKKMVISRQQKQRNPK